LTKRRPLRANFGWKATLSRPFLTAVVHPVLDVEQHGAVGAVRRIGRDQPPFLLHHHQAAADAGIGEVNRNLEVGAPGHEVQAAASAGSAARADAPSAERARTRRRDLMA
jgi:hypothetical protein